MNNVRRDRIGATGSKTNHLFERIVYLRPLCDAYVGVEHEIDHGILCPAWFKMS
jgi:hypothetical protein